MAKLYTVNELEFTAAKLAFWLSLKEITALNDNVKMLIL